METNKVFDVIAFCSSFKLIKPSDLTGRYVTLKSFFLIKIYKIQVHIYVQLHKYNMVFLSP